MLSTKSSTSGTKVKSPSVKSPDSNSSSSKQNVPVTFSTKVDELIVKPPVKRNSTMVGTSPSSTQSNGKSPKDSPTNSGQPLKRQSTFIKRGSFSEISLQKVEGGSDKNVMEVSLKILENPIVELALSEADKGLREIYSKNLTPIVHDKSGNLLAYINYKGNVCDFKEFEMLKAQGLTTKSEFVEMMRLRLVSSMKLGHIIAFYLGDIQIDLVSFFEKVSWFKVPFCLEPENLKNEEFFKNNVLKDEEDINAQKLKGGFKLHNDFVLIILTSDEVIKVRKNLGVPPELFESVHVV